MSKALRHAAVTLVSNPISKLHECPDADLLKGRRAWRKEDTTWEDYPFDAFPDLAGISFV
jgi:hypothetical protein